MGSQVSAAGRCPSPPGPSDANADWMSALSPRLWDVPLHQLCIPGEAACAPRGCGMQVGSWVR